MKKGKKNRIKINRGPKKETASYENNKSSTVNAEKNTSKDSIFKTLKKIFSPGMMQVVVGIIAAIGTWWALWEDPVEKLKKDIDEQISIIESEFHPNSLKVDYLSTADFQLVKDFQISALEVAVQWKSLKNLKQLNEYKESDSETIREIAISQFKTINHFDKAVIKLIRCIHEIEKYGIEKNITSFIPTKDKLLYLKDKAGSRFSNTENEFGKIINNLTVLQEKYGQSYFKKIPLKEMKKALKPYENINKSEDYEFIKTFTTYVVELNAMYMFHINQISYR